MVRLTARYDGKVLVPDGAVDLPTDVPLRITVDVEAPNEAGDIISKLTGLGAEIWEGIDPVEYQRQERRGWQ